ncbi:MAG: septal ring lytic transglycosylase RlpA family protein [Bacteroidaceae bacterium]|nr:septal ring lytic transglycosylase RlpA family protein [Bacteroidaceae bacterium]
MKRNLCAKKLFTARAVAELIIILLLCCIATNLSAQTYTGKASYYGSGFHGRKCANGEAYNMYKYTCAHKSLPFGTKLKVTNNRNGKSTIVEVTDRGPYAKGRIIDLSKAAAMELDMVKAGVANVTIEIINDSETETDNQSASHVPMILFVPELSNEFLKEIPRIDPTIEYASLVR